MANSDNVVRAGLTPKFKDVERLLEMLDYTSAVSSPTDSLRFSATQPTPTPEGVSMKSFIPPVSEFAVDEIQVRPIDSLLIKHLATSISPCY